MRILRFSVLVGAFLICTSMQAQWLLGLKSGIAKSWEDYGDVTTPDGASIHINGFQLSAMAYYKISSNFWVGAEPGWVERGAACEPGFIIFNEDTKLFLNYLEVPVMAATQLPIYKQQIFLRAKAGFGAAYIASAFREIQDLNNVEPTTRNRLTFDGEGAMNRWDYGLHGGLALSYAIRQHEILLDGNYYYGLPDVDAFVTSRNRTLNVSIGYLIHLHAKK
ncbi:MAG: PorT family protein [Saprospiraceae bacterium]|nr:PorT family protein [Saprospiraceae bacterium]